MTEPIVHNLSGLLFSGLDALLYIAAGILLLIAGRFLAKRKTELSGRFLFACFAVGAVCVLWAILDLTSLLSAAGSLLC